MRRVALLLSAIVLLALVLAPAASARVELTDVEDEVMCPVCGTPLNLSQSPQADREREFIRRLIAQGDSKQEIKDKLVAQYGEEVLAVPDDEGFQLTAWVVPAAGIVTGVLVLMLLVPRWRRRSGTADAEGSVNGHTRLDPADARRLDEDLARYDV
jgi:cytochrome c-type biogenesis protein CcmH/NrfF